jgi:hypothetical protein
MPKSLRLSGNQQNHLGPPQNLQDEAFLTRSLTALDSLARQA